MSEQSIFARLLFVLAGHSRTGLRLKPIADGIGESPSTTLRNLQRLAEDGLVERSPFDQDNWRLSPRIVQIALAHQAEVAREERQLDDFKNRYSRSPN
ncbi:TPA: helix-turn-helix domain-containing protein [Stenotrophomonas maltophilia]|uniref:helix-turn-helix domain-containing protein n=1 Tax=Stenotrophomonas maltophilia TaxID=40324 RepID=UPI0011D22F0D|nr:helix-turn-helix domain-containing protein [Stenotrophomonas maltophilia]MBH1464952.1 helix-turn-helix domain-containing protein [Stenotrophomonas maltophilia]MBH1614824.1 helix-turn-helix domain-containing protein [Stenotrophomonas maltophilia]MBN5168196.1 helix-turn-helix domain-containing protein [Stenotrophomonas maltophilia]MCU1041876.1 helix-turn-helix domain-containing protein [Stenotrophomonas maltophilia]HEL3850646.1 helix-turn-helix domain-containing protein [Stenotrophomonas malt